MRRRRGRRAAAHATANDWGAGEPGGSGGARPTGDAAAPGADTADARRRAANVAFVVLWAKARTARRCQVELCTGAADERTPAAAAAARRLHRCTAARCRPQAEAMLGAYLAAMQAACSSTAAGDESPAKEDHTNKDNNEDYCRAAAEAARLMGGGGEDGLAAASPEELARVMRRVARRQLLLAARMAAPAPSP
jgi:hypothetical protein